MTNEIEQTQENEQEIQTVVINTGTSVNLVAVEFFREDISRFCEMDVDGCNNKPKWVHPSDMFDTACAVHQKTIVPRRRREFIKIEDVPSKNKSSDELLAEAVADLEPLEEITEEDFVLTDEDVATQ